MHIMCTPEELKRLLRNESTSIDNLTKENSSVIPVDKLTDEQLKQVDDYLTEKL